MSFRLPSKMTRPLLTRLMGVTLALTATVASSTGCFVVNNNDRGDIAFLWSFNGEPDCREAGVANVLVTVRQGSTVAFEDILQCSGGGLTVRDFAPGNYDVFLEGLASDDFLLFEGSAPVTVVENRVTDIGEIFLSRPTGNLRTGDVQFAWTFQYPNNNSVETDCARAGVLEVDVLLTPAPGNNDGETYSRTFNCTDDGVRVEDLIEGDYDLVLSGYGRYGNNDIDLFESAPLRVVIIENDPDLVGDVNLLRKDENFADIDVNWVLPAGETCSSLGITNLAFSMVRAGSGVVDDAFDVQCDAAQTALRANFVPGAYTIEATALGSGGATYIGALTADVAPGTTTNVDVNIVQQ